MQMEGWSCYPGAAGTASGRRQEKGGWRVPSELMKQ